MVGAFGDDLDSFARRFAEPLKLSPENLDRLRDFGRCMNCNAYGETVDDSFFRPAALYRMIKPYGDPLRFLERESNVVDKLREGRLDDLSRTAESTAQVATAYAAICVLPDAPWSRRVRKPIGTRAYCARPRGFDAQRQQRIHR